MDYSNLLLRHGEDLQVWVFFICLGLFFGLERLFPRRPRPAHGWPRWRTNLLLTTINVTALGVVPVSFIGGAAWAEQQAFGLLNWLPFPTWAAVTATLLLRGFISFFTHYLYHMVPLLWRLHRVHHLDTDLDISSTVRFHPLEMLTGPLIGLPLVIGLGLSPWVLLFYELLDAAVTLFSHSNLRLPAGLNRWLRYWIVTPDLHRIHHSVRQPETDSNFSAVFPVWDLVFGTFRPEPSAPPELMALGLAELRDANTDRLGYLLRAPFLPAQPDRPASSLLDAVPSGEAGHQTG
jgi:sterol desaturase/sphingolipid hydroxylase (fatty acid hydroxylase superfamily)